MTSLSYLEFRENQLFGFIALSIGSLVGLSYLDFSQNKFSGSIPESYSSYQNSPTSIYRKTNYPAPYHALSKLVELDLSINHLIHRIPRLERALWLIGKSRILALQDNKLSGNIPSSIGDMIGLNTLYLSNNNRSSSTSSISKILTYHPTLHTIPPWLQKLPLQRLRLGELPEWIGNMSSLWFLNLSNNNFNSSLPHQIKQLSISDIDLHSNSLSGKLTELFSNASGSFNSIDLSHNNFSGEIDAGVGDLAVMKELESLILSHNPLSGKIPESLSKLLRLKVLKLESNGLSGEIQAELGELALLETLALSENGLTGKIPARIFNLDHLVSFNVSGNRLSGEIPTHKLAIPASSFGNNSCLYGAPLPPCKSLSLY